MSKIFDLSQRVESGMSFFPGDPEPVVEPSPQISPPWQITNLKIGSHTGTHIDAANHFIPGGRSIDQYGPERFILPGVLIRLPGLNNDQIIDLKMLEDHIPQIPKGGAAIIQTAWNRFWKTPQYEEHPYLSESATRALVAAGSSLVGIDALNVDSTVQGTNHVHQLLLSEDILIVENLTGLSQLQPGKLYQFSFLPLLISGSDGAPVRAVAWENNPF